MKKTILVMSAFALMLVACKKQGTENVKDVDTVVVVTDTAVIDVDTVKVDTLVKPVTTAVKIK